MKPIPTAEELLLEINEFSKTDMKNKYSIEYAVKQKMIEFAKLHAEAQAEAISKKVQINGLNVDVDKDSILNAYPETNIT